MWNRITQRLQGRNRTALAVLGVLSVSLVLRGDEGCITADRTMEGIIALTLTAEWTSTGFAENTDTDNGNAGDYADDIIDALDDVSTSEIEAALAAGKEVTVAGMRARVTENRGHDSPRTATVMVTTSTAKAQHTLLTLFVPHNREGSEANASDSDDPADPDDPWMDLNPTGVNALKSDITAFFQAYVDGDEAGARAILDGIAWNAAWVSSNPPSSESRDDFDWITEVILHVPIQFEGTVPNF